MNRFYQKPRFKIGWFRLFEFQRAEGISWARWI